MVGEVCTGTQSTSTKRGAYPTDAEEAERWRRGGGDWRSDLKGAVDRPTSGSGCFKGSFYFTLSFYLYLSLSFPFLDSPVSLSLSLYLFSSVSHRQFRLAPPPSPPSDNRAWPWYFLLKCPHFHPRCVSPIRLGVRVRCEMPRRTKKRFPRQPGLEGTNLRGGGAGTRAAGRGAAGRQEKKNEVDSATRPLRLNDVPC